MAFVNTTGQNTGINFGQIVNNAIAQIKTASARRAVYREVYGQLHNMSDRDLADIGVSRITIRDVAVQAAYGAA